MTQAIQTTQQDETGRDWRDGDQQRGIAHIKAARAGKADVSSRQLLSPLSRISPTAAEETVSQPKPIPNSPIEMISSKIGAVTLRIIGRAPKARKLPTECGRAPPHCGVFQK